MRGDEAIQKYQKIIIHIINILEHIQYINIKKIYILKK